MKLRFQADADLNQIIVRAVLRREPTIDFQTAHDGKLAGVEDPEVLSRAAEAGRILVTHDGKTIPTHFGQFITKHQSPGVLIVPQSLPGHLAADDLIVIWSASEAEEWQNRIFYLPI